MPISQLLFSSSRLHACPGSASSLARSLSLSSRLKLKSSSPLHASFTSSSFIFFTQPAARSAFHSSSTLGKFLPRPALSCCLLLSVSILTVTATIHHSSFCFSRYCSRRRLPCSSLISCEAHCCCLVSKLPPSASATSSLLPSGLFCRYHRRRCQLPAIVFQINVDVSLPPSSSGSSSVMFQFSRPSSTSSAAAAASSSVLQLAVSAGVPHSFSSYQLPPSLPSSSLAVLLCRCYGVTAVPSFFPRHRTAQQLLVS